jgi:hypothetical protein
MDRYEQDDLGLSDAAHDSFLDCPTCGLPMEVTERFTLGGAPAPVEHVKVVCVRRHWYTIPVDQLPGIGPMPNQAGISPITQWR